MGFFKFSYIWNWSYICKPFSGLYTRMACFVTQLRITYPVVFASNQKYGQYGPCLHFFEVKWAADWNSTYSVCRTYGFWGDQWRKSLPTGSWTVSIKQGSEQLRPWHHWRTTTSHGNCKITRQQLWINSNPEVNSSSLWGCFPVHVNTSTVCYLYRVWAH